MQALWIQLCRVSVLLLQIIEPDTLTYTNKKCVSEKESKLNIKSWSVIPGRSTLSSINFYCYTDKGIFVPVRLKFFRSTSIWNQWQKHKSNFIFSLADSYRWRLLLVRHEHLIRSYFFLSVCFNACFPLYSSKHLFLIKGGEGKAPFLYRKTEWEEVWLAKLTALERGDTKHWSHVLFRRFNLFSLIHPAFHHFIGLSLENKLLLFYIADPRFIFQSSFTNTWGYYIVYKFFQIIAKQWILSCHFIILKAELQKNKKVLSNLNHEHRFRNS